MSSLYTFQYTHATVHVIIMWYGCEVEITTLKNHDKTVTFIPGSMVGWRVVEHRNFDCWWFYGKEGMMPVWRYIRASPLFSLDVNERCCEFEDWRGVGMVQVGGIFIVDGGPGWGRARRCIEFHRVTTTYTCYMLVEHTVGTVMQTDVAPNKTRRLIGRNSTISSNIAE